jgi:preprotein translocase subunit SecE
MAKAIALPDDNSRSNTGIDNLKATPQRLIDFLKDVRSEMRKVVWPSQKDVQTTTIVVLITVFIFAAYFWLVDNIIGHAIDLVLKKLVSK